MMPWPFNYTDRDLLQRALILLEQHDRIKKRGWGSTLPSDMLIRDLRGTLTPEELADCDKHVPKEYRRDAV